MENNRKNVVVAAAVGLVVGVALTLTLYVKCYKEVVINGVKTITCTTMFLTCSPNPPWKPGCPS